jgi:hypothetical protein
VKLFHTSAAWLLKELAPSSSPPPEGIVIVVDVAMTGALITAAPVVPFVNASLSSVMPPALVMTYDQLRTSEADKRVVVLPSVVIVPINELPACCEGYDTNV